jgi:nicotinate phosphoribosyltransferase
MAATSAPPASAHANGNGNGSLAGVAAPVGAPTNPMATALLTDQYQFSMAYAYWKAGKHADRAV